MTCLLLRAIAVAKEQVTEAAVFAMEQVVMAVVRAVSWCMRWCGEVRSRKSQADALSTVSCLCFPSPLTKEMDPEVCFTYMPECKRPVRPIFLGRGPEKHINMWKL